jgi:ribosome-associated protein
VSVVDRPRVLSSGDLDIGDGVVVSARDVAVRSTTSGGPGGQHANRTRSRIVATVDVAHAASLAPDVRARLVAELGPLVTASASGSRSQFQNKQLALERLARKIADGLAEDPNRVPTRPTKASVSRRIEEKRRRSATKAARRATDD